VRVVNDGSKDRSARCCGSSFSASANTRVVLFHANFGQHSAVMAGLSYAPRLCVTLDADLQNLPKRSASSWRSWTRATITWAHPQQRQDMLWRAAVRSMNAIRERSLP